MHMYFSRSEIHPVDQKVPVGVVSQTSPGKCRITECDV